jgi:hypothetical protein
MLQTLAIWYVYELIDPRDGQVFYVGKGKNGRINDHEAEAKSGHPSFKCNKIRSIWADGCQVIKQKVATFWDEESAYQFEECRIAEIGLDNLTNVMAGGRRKDVPYRLQNKPKAHRKSVVVPIDICWMIVRRFTGWVALWLRRPEPNSKAKIEHLRSPIQGAILECLLNVVLPIAWKRIITDPANHAELKELMRPWHIDLVFEP